MKKTNKLLVFITLMTLAAILLVSPIFAGASWASGNKETVTIPKEEYERLKKYELLDEVKKYVDAYFYEEPKEQDMLDGAIQGLLAGLGDSYSFYYPQEAWNKMQEDDSGKYAGIGVMMLGNYKDRSVTIVRVFKDTPAERAGLKKGDVFYKVEDVVVSTATMHEAVDIMRGKPGEKVNIEIIRNDETLPFELVKANITVNRADYKMIDDKVGYLILYEFAGGSKEAFKEGYEALKAQGMQYLIFDLRDNPGGWVGDAEAIGNMLMDKKLLYYTMDRFERRKEYVTTQGAETMPITVLVNDHSASASEILAGALKENKRAQIVGEQTFGKGVIQYVVPLSDEKSGFQFTAAQYFSPEGNKVHKEGVTPDIVVEMPEELKTKLFETGDLSDPQLAAAYKEALKSFK